MEEYTNREQEAAGNDTKQAVPPQGELTDKLWYHEKHSFPIPEKVMEKIRRDAEIIAPQVPSYTYSAIFPRNDGYTPSFAEQLTQEKWHLQNVIGALREILMNFDGPEDHQLKTVQYALEREMSRLDAINSWAQSTAHYDPLMIRRVLEALEEYPELDPGWTEDAEECEEEEPGNGKAEMADQVDDRPYASDIDLGLQIWSDRHKGLLKTLGMVIWDLQQTPIDKQPDLSPLSPLHEAIEKHMDELDTSIKDCGRCRLRNRGRVDAGVAIQEREQEEQPTVQ